MPIKYNRLYEINNMTSNISLTNFKSPEVLVAQIDDSVFKFIHYDYMMKRCIWPKPLITSQKVVIFKGIYNLLRDKYSQNLSAQFREEDDMYAWNLSLGMSNH